MRAKGSLERIGRNLITGSRVTELRTYSVILCENIFTRALLPQKFLPKGMDLVGGGSLINGAFPV